ncbi:MAG: hypothetical protein NTY46_11240 [Candidatus Sumerlaeota bacterium]|nr:hypothetical protein [Candidatus Sumerlaeota bacterium]
MNSRPLLIMILLLLLSVCLSHFAGDRAFGEAPDADITLPSVGPGCAGGQTQLVALDAPAPPGAGEIPQPLTPGTLVSFDGVDGSSLDGYMSIPPDTHMAAGAGAGNAGRVVMVTNMRVAIWDKTGALLAGPVSLNAFWGTTPTGSNASFDPKIIYDQHSDRFFICTISGRTPDPGGTSNLEITVSTSGTPGNLTTDWTKMSGSTLTAIGSYNCWYDYPGIGADNDSLFLTGNLFDSSGTNRGTKIRVFNKASLLAGSYSFVDLNYDITALTGIGTIQPAHVYGTTDNGSFYLINRYGSTLYRLWQITGDPAAPVASTATYSWTAGASMSVGAPQSGTAVTLALLSPRVMNAVYRGGHIWCTLTSDINSDSKSEVVWFKIATNSGAPTMADTGYINGSSGTQWTFMPSINANSLGQQTICYTQSGTDQYPDVRYVSRNDATDPLGTFQASVVAKTSVGFYDSFATTNPDRWGDFSATVVDPDDQHFWVANEYCKVSAVNSSVWGTWIAKLDAIAPASVADYQLYEPPAERQPERR